MKAILLAAGLGKRLGGAARGQPKCLLQFGGKSLLQRHIENLDHHGVERIIIVTGYRHEEIEDELEHIPCRAPVETLFNPAYGKGSVVSLDRAHDHLGAGTDSILMDADVLYDPEILGRLFRSRFRNCFLLDRDFETGDEPVKLCVAGGAPVEFRKKPEENQKYDYQGESVGFFRLDAGVSGQLAARARRYVDNGRADEPYEEALRDVLLETPDLFGFEDITGLAWIEIDFPADAARAATEILGRFAPGGSGRFP